MNMDDDDPITPAEAEHHDAMAAQDAHYGEGHYHFQRRWPDDDARDALADCPHPVDAMGTVFAHPSGQARRVCTACWHDFGPLTPAERSAAVAQYPSIAEPSSPNDEAIAGRMLFDVLSVNPGLTEDDVVLTPLLALIRELDYQTMLLRNRVESIRRMEEEAWATLRERTKERDQAEADVLDLLDDVPALAPEHGAMRARYERQRGPLLDQIAGIGTSRFTET